MTTQGSTRSWAVLTYQLLIGAACAVGIFSILLPWYHQQIVLQSDSETKYSAKLFFQIFYLYSVPDCNGSVKCPVAFQELFLVDVPDIDGLTWWRLTNEDGVLLDLHSTRWLFLTVWIFQAVTLISLPVSLYRGGQSNMTSIVSLIAGGSSVLIFFFLPDTLDTDYGYSCTSRADAISPYLTSTTPCDTFLNSGSLSNDMGVATASWGPAIGFYCACINMFLCSLVYLLSTSIHPCTVVSRPPSVLWDDDDPDDLLELDGSSSLLVGTDSSSLIASSYGSINASAGYS